MKSVFCSTLYPVCLNFCKTLKKQKNLDIWQPCCQTNGFFAVLEESERRKKTSDTRDEECQPHDHFSGSSMLFEMSDINISPTLFPQLYPIHMRSSFDGFLHRCSRRCRRRTASFSSVGFVTDLLMHYFVTTTVG